MPKTPIYTLNRETSWLHFNARVLQEAADHTVPLIERIKFLGIYSNNLDEFYRVRVATINRMLGVNKKMVADIDPNPKKTLKEISKITVLQEKEFSRIFKVLIKELGKENIFIINERGLSTAQGQFVRQYFREHVRSQLFPLMMNTLKASALKDKSIYLTVHLQVKHKSALSRYAIIKVPLGPLGRFVILPPEGDKKFIILLEDVIRYCLEDIFSIFGFDAFQSYVIKFTRDAELDIDNDISKSFVEIMTESLKQRSIAPPVRLIYDKDMPAPLLDALAEKLLVTERDTLVRSNMYQNFKDFMNFPNVGSHSLEYQQLQPLEHPLLPMNKSILAKIRESDIMLHYPYQSFNYLIDLLREASIDPQVRAIKMTLYRVARDSNVVNALINAARNGKEVTVFLELQARFDEEANIYWSEKMQKEGVRIIQTITGYKVHCKLLLIRRREVDKNVYYANIGTGNYNETTAMVYADCSLFTADKQIVSDVNNVFHLFDSKYNTPRFKQLVVAPFHMRNFFIKMLNEEIKYAKAGKEAWVILKLNNLVDLKIVKKLCEASQAGVKIQLIMRGICVLVPGVKGQSENIEAISIVDKFLEHSRVLVFCNGGNAKYFISSADWMIRNFDHRIEVACPINNREIQRELLTMLQIQLKDNTKSRIISNTQPNQYRHDHGTLRIRSQEETYHYFKNKLF
ncbi:MAG TPA: polyphosphate kinase 1 [Bacteroidales bacterium]